MGLRNTFLACFSFCIQIYFHVKQNSHKSTQKLKPPPHSSVVPSQVIECSSKLFNVDASFDASLRDTFRNKKNTRIPMRSAN